jgi:hypothetical protein
VFARLRDARPVHDFERRVIFSGDAGAFTLAFAGSRPQELIGHREWHRPALQRFGRWSGGIPGGIHQQAEFGAIRMSDLLVAGSSLEALNALRRALILRKRHSKCRKTNVDEVEELIHSEVYYTPSLDIGPRSQTIRSTA